MYSNTERNCNLMESLHICIVIPTFNNAPVLSNVIASVLPYCHHILVVNDGSTDATSTILQSFLPHISVISYPHNRGKGYALRQGLLWARLHHFDAVLTLDSDGQHLASDIPLLVQCYQSHPHAFIMGSRSFSVANIPAQNTFANKFSNFWFRLQTGVSLSDTQSGFRIYPLAVMKRMLPHSHRYEAELELLVRMAWRNISINEAPIHVYYPPSNERISHFRPTIDFLRISLLNVLLCLAALLYGYPSRLIRKRPK